MTDTTSGNGTVTSPLPVNGALQQHGGGAANANAASGVTNTNISDNDALLPLGMATMLVLRCMCNSW
jgi:hypothetical protein